MSQSLDKGAGWRADPGMAAIRTWLPVAPVGGDTRRGGRHLAFLLREKKEEEMLSWPLIPHTFVFENFLLSPFLPPALHPPPCLPSPPHPCPVLFLPFLLPLSPPLPLLSLPPPSFPRSLSHWDTNQLGLIPSPRYSQQHRVIMERVPFRAPWFVSKP